MTNINHTTETMDSGTVVHTYTSGPFKMIVSTPAHVKIRVVGHTYIRVGLMPGLDPGEPDYLIETTLPSRPCDLEILIEDSKIARDVLHDFREILLNDHQITTTLNGK